MAICEHKSLRFSDINMMNDEAESAYGYSIFENAADVLLKERKVNPKLPAISVDFFDRVDALLSPQQVHSHPVISCFSRLPDILSQWRAYANDGRGFCLGFPGEVLDAMPASLLEVEYDPERQMLEMKAALLAIFLKNLDSKKLFGSEFRQDCLLLGAWKFGFKHPSFAEEKEVRCLHLLDVIIADGKPQLVDAGGQSEGVDVDGQPVRFRTVDGSIVAYVDIPLPLRADRPVIKQVWSGPKNQNGLGNIVYMASHFDLGGFTVHQSTSTYR